MAEDKKQNQSPPAAQQKKEIFYENLCDGELYSLAVREPDGYGRTHRLTNEAHTWDGTEREFHDAFRRID